MKDPNNDRPKVTKVKVTVKSNIVNPSGYESELVFTVDKAANSGNFDYYPKLYLSVGREYQTKGDIEYASNGGVHTVTYTDDVNIFDLECEVEVEAGGSKKEICFNFIKELPGCQ